MPKYHHMWHTIGKNFNQVQRMAVKNNLMEEQKRLINDSFCLGKKVVRRTRKSAEYLAYAAIKKGKQDDYDRGCMLYNQYMHKSKSISGDCPLPEGYVTELGMDNKSKDGIMLEKTKIREAKRFEVVEHDHTDCFDEFSSIIGKALKRKYNKMLQQKTLNQKELRKLQ